MSSRRPAELTGFRVARVAGIDITVHGSWLVSLILLSGFAHVFIVEDLLRGRSPLLTVPVAVAFALPIASCIVLHEFGHCLVARAYGLPVRRITLFAFGGVSQIDADAPHPRAEYHIAIAGPLVSLILATVFGGVARTLNPSIKGLLGPWGAFALVNLMLALFNLLPAFPMDGGRVLRSALWAATSRRTATRWASATGRAFGVLMMAGGFALLFPVVAGAPAANGVYVALLGLFLFMAARAAGNSERGDDEERK